MDYVIYTDGAATMKKENGQYIRVAGGWSFIVYKNGIQCYCEYGGEKETTNNAMELMAILKAIQWLETREEFSTFSQYTIFTDSSYCFNIFNSWAKNWARNGWTRGMKKQPIENLDIIKLIFSKLVEHNNIRIDKVRGHSSVAGNLLADELAKKGKKEAINS